MTLNTSVLVGDIALFTPLSSKEHTDDIMYIL